MPIKKAAYKAIKKSKVKHARNAIIKSELKTIVKKFDKLIAGKKTDEAKKMVDIISSKFCRAASKGIIHKNTASRKISRLKKRLAASTKT
mgnify:CR=1 FL=1